MTVFELIGELTKYPANAEIEFEVRIPEQDVNCENCGVTTNVKEENTTFSFEEIRQHGDAWVIFKLDY